MKELQRLLQYFRQHLELADIRTLMKFLTKKKNIDLAKDLLKSLDHNNDVDKLERFLDALSTQDKEDDDD